MEQSMANSDLFPRDETKCIVLIDFEDNMIRGFPSGILKEIIDTLSAHFPDKASKFLVYNASSTVVFLISAVSKMLPRSTAQKIVLLGKEANELYSHLGDLPWVQSLVRPAMEQERESQYTSLRDLDENKSLHNPTKTNSSSGCTIS